MSYTYGICGPLKLSVDTAATLTTVYYTCFMTGRLSGIFVSRWILRTTMRKTHLYFILCIFCRYIIPRTLVLTSMISCIVAAIILCIWGQTHAGLFLGTGLLGLGVAVQFPRYRVSQQVLDRYLLSKNRQIKIRSALLIFADFFF